MFKERKNQGGPTVSRKDPPTADRDNRQPQQRGGGGISPKKDDGRNDIAGKSRRTGSESNAS